MGLLDDAIREHLDLKRARGGDPAEIERMEREALGPVRREPTIGSVRVETLEERAPMPLDSEFQDEHLDELEELQEQGYNDSTAPHPHPHHASAEQHSRLEHDAAFEEETEQPRRRFLRRSRQSPGPALPAEGYPDDNFDPLDHPPLEPHDPLAHDEPPFDPPAHAEQHLLERDDQLERTEPPVEHDEPVVACDEPLGHDEPIAYDDPLEPPTVAGSAVPPPHLQFDRPPKRPRFSAEPPELQQEAPAAAQPEEQVEAQETTEFDVQRHIAETRHQADEIPSTPAAPTQPAPDQLAPLQPPPTQPAPPQPAAAQPDEDEDVLEETPEFLQDTPEHDRLWFEQRPPKDFDFDG